MPLVQDESISDLNHFIDVANKDDDNLIVVAARQMPPQSVDTDSYLATNQHQVAKGECCRECLQ